MVIDPHSGSYTQYSPYSYVINNPLRIIDPNGMDVFFLIWDSQAMNSSDLYESMLTRKKEIEESKGFNSKSDHIYTLDVSDLGKLKEIVDANIKDAIKNKYGKTVEVSFFTHGASQGPVGSEKASGEYRLSIDTGEPLDDNQLSLEGWKSINWNLDPKRNIICAFGCNTADWASDVSKIEGVKFSAGQSGKTGGTYDLEKWNSVWINLFGRNVYQRSSTGDKVNSMFIYQNGIEISAPDKKPIKQNPTFEVVNQTLIIKTPKGIK